MHRSASRRPLQLKRGSHIVTPLSVDNAEMHLSQGVGSPVSYTTHIILHVSVHV